MRDVTGPITRFLLRPGCVGALYVVALAARARDGASGDLDFSGTASLAATTFTRDVVARLEDSALRATVGVFAAAIAFGVVLGAVAGFLVALRDRMGRIHRRSPLRRAWGVLGVTAGLHACLVLREMAVRPDLFSSTWYAQGGARRALLVFVTDVLRPGGVVFLGALALGAYLAGPPSQWRSWPPRLARAFLPRKLRRSVAQGLAGTALVMLALPLFAPSSSARADAPALSLPRPNVLLLAVDSLRADRLTVEVAPRLTELAARGARFERAYVSSGSSFSSWVTLLTGQDPHHHGIRSDFPRWEDRARDFDALPARLAAAGYRTEIVGDAAGDDVGRVELGFAHVDVPRADVPHTVRANALARQTPLLPLFDTRLGRAAFPGMRALASDPDGVADGALRAITRGGAAPFFVTAVFSAARAPYAAASPAYRRFTRASYRGRFKYGAPSPIASEPAVGDDDVAQVRGLYDGAVASVDAACGRLLAALRGAPGPTIIVLASDHGETLFEGDHGRGHGAHLFGDEGTHVPLVIVDSSRTHGARPTAIVRDVDVAPTLYDLVGVAPPGNLDGRSLAPMLDAKGLDAKDGAPSLAFAETGLWLTDDVAGLPAALRLPQPNSAQMLEVDADHRDEIVTRASVRLGALVAKHRMVRDDRFKLVYAPTRMGAKYMLFDTRADPMETRDVIAEHPADEARLKSELSAWMARDVDMRMVHELLVPRDVASLGASGGAP